MNSFDVLEALKGLLENIVNDLETDNISDNTISDIDNALELIEKEIGEDKGDD